MPPNKLAYGTVLHLNKNQPDHMAIRYNEQMSASKATFLVVG